jgi:hypothetical protein
MDLISFEGIIAPRADWEFIRDLLLRKSAMESWRNDDGTAIAAEEIG